MPSSFPIHEVLLGLSWDFGELWPAVHPGSEFPWQLDYQHEEEPNASYGDIQSSVPSAALETDRVLAIYDGRDDAFDCMPVGSGSAMTDSATSTTHPGTRVAESTTRANRESSLTSKSMIKCEHPGCDATFPSRQKLG